MPFKSEKQRRGLFGHRGQPYEYVTKSREDSHGKMTFRHNKKGDLVVPKEKMDWSTGGNVIDIDRGEENYHRVHRDQLEKVQNRLMQARIENHRTNFANGYVMSPKSQYSNEDHHLESNPLFRVKMSKEQVHELNEKEKKYVEDSNKGNMYKSVYHPHPNDGGMSGGAKDIDGHTDDYVESEKSMGY